MLGNNPGNNCLSRVDKEGEGGEGTAKLSFKPLGDIDRMPEGERWLIEDLLSKSSIQVLAASPKVGKTWVALSMAVAVASGTPALGRFHVSEPGPVMLFPAEDDVRAIRERIEQLCVGQGLRAEALRIDVITEDRLQLDDETHRQMLEAVLKERRPKLLILDPLVRLHSGAESYVGHVSELFGYLRSLERRFGVAIVVTHHVSKNLPKGVSPGGALRGSSDIHASYDHGALLQREPDGRIVLTLEHRVAASPEPFAFRLVSHEGGATTFEEVELVGEDEEAPAPQPARQPRRTKPVPQRSPQPTKPLSERVIAILEQSQGAVSQVSIRGDLKVRNQALTEALRQLEREGRVEHLGRMKGWRMREAEASE